MALIEGVGDEVTVLFGVVFCFLVLVLAWVSTHTTERSEQLFVSVVSAAGPGGTERLSEVPAEPVIQPTVVQKNGEEEEEETTTPPTASTAVEPDAADTTSGGLRHRVTCTTQENSSSLPHPPPEDTSPRGEPVDGGADQTMVLRLKFLNDTERLARVRPEDTVCFLKRTYFPGQEHQVRLIYQGQLLRDDAQTVASLHLTDNCVLHCHISQHATPQMPAGTRVADQVNTALNIGSLMVPLFVLILALLWYFQIQYRQFFTATATVCLAGVTILFSFMAFTVYRR